MENQETEAPVVETEEKEETATEEVVEVASDEEIVTQDEMDSLRSDEVIDVEWDKVQQIYEVNNFSKGLDEQLADLCLMFEKRKHGILKRISESENFLFSQGGALKDSMRIDPTLTYELKLPKEEGEKAFFVRKDA